MPTIRVERKVLDVISDEAENLAPHEACGLLAGRDGIIQRAYPATNAAQDSKSRYEIAPEELFRLMRSIRDAGLELLGIYHSHPHSENVPSGHDIERAFYPEAAYFILSPHSRTAKPVRAYSIRNGQAIEMEVEAE
jgi:proteasome lid subunit RPN8/RPN11